MARCDVAIELETRDNTVRGGSTLRGAVLLQADGDVLAEGVNLTLRWETHGKGNRDQDTVVDRELGPQRLLAGEALRLPFEVKVPNGPATYHGHYVNVDWTVKAEVDLPWALDAKATAEFVLVPDPDRPYEAGPELNLDGLRHAERRSDRTGRIVGAVAGAIFALVGLPMVAFALLGPSDGDQVGLIFGGGIFGLVGVFIFWKSVSNLMASAFLGQVTVDVSPTWVRPGEQLALGVTVQPSRAAQISSVDAVLRCNERAVSGSGTSQTTHRKQVVNLPLQVSGPISLEAGQLHTFQAQYLVPQGSPTTFKAEDNGVEWLVAVEIRVPSWPDWSETLAVVVAPSEPARPSAD